MNSVLDDVQVEELLAIQESFPEAKSPDSFVAHLSGEDQSEFIDWWLPQQLEWQNRAVAVAGRLVAMDDVGDIPEWLLEWWVPILQMPWAERLGEAVEAGEAWVALKCP